MGSQATDAPGRGLDRLPIPLVLAALAAVLPIVFLAPSWLPGRTFLPRLPSALPPLSIEAPERAPSADEGANRLAASDALRLVSDERASSARSRFAGPSSWDTQSGIGRPRGWQSPIEVRYPPHAVLLFVFPPRLALSFATALHLFAAGLGLAFFLRARGFTNGAQIFGAIAVQASAYGLWHAYSPATLASAAWLPWSLVAIEAIATVRRPQRAAAALAAATALSFLGGATDVALLGLVAALGYGLLRMATSGERQRAMLLLPCALIGIAIGAASWLPAWEGSRSAHLEHPREITKRTLPRAAMSSALVPGLFGLPTDPFAASENPLAHRLTSEHEKAGARHARPLDWNLSAGLGVLVLALSGIVASPRRALLPTLALAGTWIYAFGIFPSRKLELGLYGFIAPPEAALAISWFVVPWLAAIGLECIAKRRASTLAIAIVIGVGSFALGYGLWKGIDPDTFGPSVAAAAEGQVDALSARIAAERLVTEGRWLALFAVASTLSAIGTFVLGGRFDRARTVTLGVLAPWALLACAEGLRLSRASLTPRPLGAEPLFPPSPALDAVRRTAGSGRVLRLASSPADAERLAPAALLACYGVRTLDTRGVWSSEALTSALAELDPALAGFDGPCRITRPELLDAPFLDVLRITCVLSAERVDHALLEHELGMDGFHVYRRRSASRGTPAVRLFPARDSLEPPTELVFPPLEGADVFPEGWRPGQLAISHPHPDRVEVRLNGTSGGWLIVYDAWNPGWSATIDGLPAALHRAQWAMRAVRVPPGDALVQMAYEPRAPRRATLTWVGGLLAWLALLFWPRRRQ